MYIWNTFFTVSFSNTEFYSMCVYKYACALFCVFSHDYYVSTLLITQYMFIISNLLITLYTVKFFLYLGPV